MYCKHCNVNIDTAYDECPLCHAPLEGNARQYPPFPEKQPHPNRRPVTFTGIYVALTFPVVLVCIILNIVLPHDNLWALMTALAALYVYFTCKTTVFYKGVGGAKVFSQTILLTMLVISVQYIFKTSEWAFTYAVPSIVILSLAMHVLLVCIFHKKRGNQYVRYMWLTSLVGVIPAIMLAVDIVEFPYLALVAFGLSAISLLMLIAFSGRTIWEEIKKKSHI